MIREATKDDVKLLTQLALELWDSHKPSELAEEITEIMSSDKAKYFIKYDGDSPIAFAQCQLRHDYVEGTESSPVGYLEGIYVKEQFRHSGIATELLKACDAWSKEMGCREFASDCELDNTDSLKFHLAVGFEEANRIICFRKKL